MRSGAAGPLSVAFALLLALAGCAKSPISPSGALTVALAAPLAPANGADIAHAAQPVRLTVDNASTSDPNAAVVYTFEVATDAGFGTRIVTRDVAQAADRTSLTLDPLPAGQYFWRVRARAGDTAGGPSASVTFTIAPAVTMGAPAPSSPASGAIVASTRPTLTVLNASRSGPVGLVVYRFEIAADAGFATVVASGATTEGTSTTSFTPAADLLFKTTYFWRARATDTGNDITGPYSPASTFSTPTDPSIYLPGAR